MSREVTSQLTGHLETSAVVTRACGAQFDLGVISSPFEDKVRNEIWKRKKARQTKRLLTKHERQCSVCQQSRIEGS